MIIQGFEIEFKNLGWGCKPVVDGVELPESFISQKKAVEWLKSKSVKFERGFALCQREHDYAADE